MLSSFRLNGPSAWCHREAMKARSGEAPVGRSHNSDEWSRGTASMASATSYSSFVPSGDIVKFKCFSITYVDRLNFRRRLIRMQNLRFAYFLNCDLHSFCAAHKKYAGGFAGFF